MISKIRTHIDTKPISKQMLARIETALSNGLELKRWWESAEQRDPIQKFDLTRSFNQPVNCYGFFDTATIDGRSRPVIGLVEDRLFDHSVSASTDKLRENLREFVLRYLMRISDFRKPMSISESDRAMVPQPLRFLSWCDRNQPERKGFGYSQLVCKCRANNEIRQINEEARFQIADLRQIRQDLVWLVLGVRIFDFSIKFIPFGIHFPQMTIPLDESSNLVLNDEFIEDDSNPHLDSNGMKVIGSYGFGYAFVKNQDESLLGYGPGEFDIAFQLIHFRLYDNGLIRVRLVFVANRPERIVNIPVAPVDWGLSALKLVSMGMADSLINDIRPAVRRFPFRLGNFDPVLTAVRLSNVFSGGFAAKRLCISREQLEKTFLVKHFGQHYQMINGALQTWRGIEDWTDEASLPEWVKSGVSS
ncbi:MAG: hypothetical protein ABL921_04555 [Pirellula sp.]